MSRLRISRRPRFVLAFLRCAFTALLVVSADPLWALDGREVLDLAAKRNGYSGWHDRTQSVTIESYSGSALVRRHEANILEQHDPGGDQRSFIEFTGPSDVNGILFLHLAPVGGEDQQWLWSPQVRRPRRLAEGQDESSFGAELSFREVERVARLLAAKEGEAKLVVQEGEPQQVVDLISKAAEPPYSRLRLWFGKDDLLLSRVDMLDADSKAVKRLVFRGHEPVQERATPMETELTNLSSGARTVFKTHSVRYDSGVRDSTFTMANLSKGR